MILMHRETNRFFCYVSRKMCGEGSEKTWDQCRVKLKNLKSQWRYVKDRVPGIEDADMNDENVVRQLMSECQARGVSPACIKHLRLLKQFLQSLAAVRRGVSPPSYPDPDMSYKAIYSDQMESIVSTPSLKLEDDELPEDNTLDEADLIIETSPPTSPPPTHPPILRVMSPGDINSGNNKRRSQNESESGPTKKPLIANPTEVSNSPQSSTSVVLQKFQKEMMDKFLQFQREAEERFLSWEQERWRMEQNMLNRWRNEQRTHEKEMFLMFSSSLAQCSQSVLDNSL